MSARPAVSADLSEARRLLGAGLLLVKMKPFTKQPDGLEWNQHPVTSIDPGATGYGLLLAQNKLCSIDPDNIEVARVGMAALGFDLDQLMEAGVRTRSTRTGSGGRSTFAADGEIGWLTFRCGKFGTVIEFRADSPNLQDTIPGIVYRDKTGAVCRQEYANCRRLDDAPALPDDLLAWWERCSIDVEFLRHQEERFFAAVAAEFGEPRKVIEPRLSISTSKGSARKLAFAAPGIRGPFNQKHTVPSILERHGYAYHRALDRWSCPTASGAPGIRQVPGHEGLWSSDHASDPLHGTFDAWVAHIVLDHGGDLDAAIRANAPAPPPEMHKDDPGYAADDDPGPEQPGMGEAPTETARAPSILMGPDRATLRPDLFERPPEPPAMVIEGLEPRDAGQVPGAGGTGKTTLELWLAIHRILNAPVFGCDIVQPGPVLYVSAEDSRERIEYRVWRLCEALNMNDARRRSVLAGLYIEDLSSTRWRLVEADQRGNLSATALCDRLTDLYANRGLSAAVLDPLVYFGPGERYVNDGEAEVMLAARTLSRRLSCAVRFPHHTGKGQAREGTSDQYAGRGGSAGADNARFVHVLMTHNPGTSITEPAGLRAEDIAAGNILRLHVAKLTDARRPSEPFWLRREGWRLDWIPPSVEDPAVREAAALRELCMMIRTEAGRGVRHTERSLTDAFRPGEHIRTRHDLKTLRHIAEERGHIVRRPLPKEERQGSRNYFFEVASTP